MKTNYKEDIKNLAEKGIRAAKFAFEPNAKLFAGLLSQQGLEAKIFKILGHGNTVELVTHKLHHHFLVTGESTTSKILKKFV